MSAAAAAAESPESPRAALCGVSSILFGHRGNFSRFCEEVLFNLYKHISKNLFSEVSLTILFISALCLMWNL